MNVNEYLMASRDKNSFDVLHDIAVPIVGRIKCRDGFSLSVQATHGSYCSPRHNIGPWYEVEVGFPSSEPELIMQYAEEKESPTKTVYGYVPIELVDELIALHGGSEQLDN